MTEKSENSNDSKQRHASLEGHEPPMDSPQAVADAIEKAFDYRGDVMLALAGGQVIEGYIFDRRVGDAPTLRIMLKDGGMQKLPYADVVGLKFSGKDTAAGKSWETWVAKYHEKKAQGLSASMEPESLEDESQTTSNTQPNHA